MLEITIPRCEPADQFRQLPYHWLQWRTPYRQDAPEPWFWDGRCWRSAGGASYSPERAAQMQWHYLAPAHCPPTPGTQRSLLDAMIQMLAQWTQEGRTSPLEELARLFTACHYAVRFKAACDDRQVQLAVEQDWQVIGLPQAYALLHRCGLLDF